MSMKHSMLPCDERFIALPNLPESRVTGVAIGSGAGEAIEKLRSLGIKTWIIPPDMRLPEPIAAHADIQMLHLGGNGIFCHMGFSAAGEWESKFSVTEIEGVIGKNYPNDVRLNCTIIGDKLICNPKTVAPEALRFADKAGMTVIPVKQGYARCSICVVDQNAIITDDSSVFAAAQNFLDDTLFISKGSIRLSGYDYGFIGGCCGKLDKDTVAFNGRVDSHADHNKIYDFMQRRNMRILELADKPLNDIGGVIPLTESAMAYTS